MDDREQRAFKALALMAEQYLKSGDFPDSLAMKAGEEALLSLTEYGLVDILPGGRIVGRWTPAGNSLLNSN